MIKSASLLRESTWNFGSLTAIFSPKIHTSSLQSAQKKF